MSFATDAWTSPNYKAYVAVTVHLEQDGVPVSMLLDLVEVARSHSGLNLAAAFAKILEDFGISNKVSGFGIAVNWLATHSGHIQILSITCDNASNNDTMIDELADLLDDFPGPANQTRCFTHVLNLVVKSIIRQFDSPKSKADKNSNEATNELFSLAGNLEFDKDDEGEDEALRGGLTSGR
jgi:hypothetical protein